MAKRAEGKGVHAWKPVTHREELEERVVEHLPLLVLVGNQWHVHFAQVLREQQDEAHRAVGAQQRSATVECQLTRFGKKDSNLVLIA